MIVVKMVVDELRFNLILICKGNVSNLRD